MSNVGVMQMVFTKRSYIALAVAVSVGFFILFNTLDEYLFFSPILVFHDLQMLLPTSRFLLQ